MRENLKVEAMVYKYIEDVLFGESGSTGDIKIKMAIFMWKFHVVSSKAKAFYSQEQRKTKLNYLDSENAKRKKSMFDKCISPTDVY